MITIKRIDTVEKLLACWKELAVDKPSRYESSLQFLQVLLDAVEHGLFVAYTDNEYTGFCIIHRNGKQATLKYLPSSSKTQVGRMCVQEVRTWLRKRGVRFLDVTTTKFSGATKRYFEGLGFKQFSVTYSLKT